MVFVRFVTSEIFDSLFISDSINISSNVLFGPSVAFARYFVILVSKIVA